MLETRTAEADSSAPINEELYGGVSNVPWHVMSVKALPDFQLLVQFADGTEGKVEMREQIFSEGAGVFRTLRDASVFADVVADDGVVTWANGLDIAPDATYDDIRAYGVQTLR